MALLRPDIPARRCRAHRIGNVQRPPGVYRPAHPDTALTTEVADRLCCASCMDAPVDASILELGARYIRISGCGDFGGRGPAWRCADRSELRARSTQEAQLAIPSPCLHPRRHPQAPPGNPAAGAVAGACSFSSARAVRATLRATATSFGGFPASHEPAPRRHPGIAPMLSGTDSYPAELHLRAVLSRRQPGREVAPRVLHRRAWIAEAGPTPGIRRASSSSAAILSRRFSCSGCRSADRPRAPDRTMPATHPRAS